MLTDTDIHYLVGLMVLSSGDDNVDVMLGDMVDDVASGTPRDVDITITARTHDGMIQAFTGVEVKAEKRPLDVIAVEQLCAKLKDMPGITQRSVVSASGYTAPAIEKARYHGTELWELKEWENPSVGFSHVAFPKGMPFVEVCLEWSGRPNVHLNPDEHIDEEVLAALPSNPPICDGEGHQIGGLADLNALTQWARDAALNQARPTLNETLKENQGCPLDCMINVSNQPQILVGHKRLIVTSARVTGHVYMRHTPHELNFKYLAKVGDRQPYAGVGICELTFGNLVGLHTSTERRDIRILNVPLSDRLKRKIRRQKLSG